MIGILVFVFAGVLIWLFVAPARSRLSRHAVDPAELDAAEREMQDLDAFVSPEDADEEFPDWGPGAPKEPRR
jgi:hypothetical protein